MKVPAGDPIVIDLLDGAIGQRRRKRRIVVPAGCQTRIPVNLRGSVEIVAADESRWRVQEQDEKAVVIGYYSGDGPIVDELVRDLTARGVVVRETVDISDPAGARKAEEAALAATSFGLAVLGPASLEFIQRPGLHLGRYRPVQAIKGIFASDLPAPIASLDHYDLTLPATGMAALLRAIAGRKDGESHRAPPPFLSLPPPAKFHHAPPADLQIRPALREVLDALPQSSDPLVLVSLHPEERLALAASLGRLSGVRRRFADGIFYVSGTEVAGSVLSALGYPVERVERSALSETARAVLRDGRCLILIDDPGNWQDREPLTGPHGRTLRLTGPEQWSEAVSRERPTIQIGAGPRIGLLHRLDDGRTAGRLAAKLQVAGVNVWLQAIESSLTPHMDATAVLLTKTSVRQPFPEPLPSGRPLIVLRHDWPGELPDALAGAVVISTGTAGWPEAVMRLLA